MRVGSEAYARANGSFGLTTLRNRHVTVSGDALRFRFRGKSGKVHEVGVRDRRLARIVARREGVREPPRNQSAAGAPVPGSPAQPVLEKVGMKR